MFKAFSEITPNKRPDDPAPAEWSAIQIAAPMPAWWEHTSGFPRAPCPQTSKTDLLKRFVSPARPIQPDRSETTVRSIRKDASTPANGRAICSMINHHKLPVAA